MASRKPPTPPARAEATAKSPAATRNNPELAVAGWAVAFAHGGDPRSWRLRTVLAAQLAVGCAVSVGAIGGRTGTSSRVGSRRRLGRTRRTRSRSGSSFVSQADVFVDAAQLFGGRSERLGVVGFADGDGRDHAANGIFLGPHLDVHTLIDPQVPAYIRAVLYSAAWALENFPGFRCSRLPSVIQP